jgi:hypothetical protein
MPTRISSQKRQEVFERAENCCEYCLLPKSALPMSHEIDHILARKHGGGNEFDNLALACFYCNHHKGSDISSIDWETNKLVRLFNPRTEIWSENFVFENGLIVPLTAEARVTVKILRLNDETRIEERRELFEIGVYRVFR